MIVNMEKFNLALARAGKLEKDLGVSRATVQKIKAGKNVRAATIGIIALALGVDPAEIAEVNGK